MGDLLYVAGGLSPSGASNVVETYDPDANTWRQGPKLPIALHHAMGVAWRKTFVVLGGFTTNDFSTPSARVFSLQGDAWTELPAMRRARAAGGAAVAGNTIVVVGGQDGARLVTETERYDGERWTDGAPIPTPRDHLGVAAIGSSVYALAGRSLTIDSTLSTFERYDVATNRWTDLAEPRTARGGFAFVALEDRLVALGGEGPTKDAGSDGVFEAVEVFRVASGRWERLPADMPRPRHGLGAGVIDGTIYTAVGGPRAGGSYTQALDGLRIVTGVRAQ